MRWGRSGRHAVVVAIALTGLAALSPAAMASPRNPTNAEIAASQANVKSKAAEVGRITAALAKADASLEASAQAAEVAAEKYNKATVDEQRATKATVAAVALAAKAQAEVEQMRDRMDELAGDNYKSGGSLGPLTVLVTSDNPADVIHDAGVLAIMGNRQVDTLAELDQARARQSNARSRAQAALQHQVAARKSAQSAKKTAEKAQAANQALVAQVTATKVRLAAQLNQARARAGLLVAARAAAVARARVEAARRAAAARAAHRPHGGGHASGVAGIAVDAALSQVGKPYVWGADGPNSYDCSGLVLWAYATAGVYLPHFSGYQYTAGQHVSLGALRPGDLVFRSYNGSPSGIHHVAMYIGGGAIVEAPFTGADVRVRDLGGGWLPLGTRPY